MGCEECFGGPCWAEVKPGPLTFSQDKTGSPEETGGEELGWLSKEQRGGGEAVTLTGVHEDQPGESENMGNRLGLAALPSSSTPMVFVGVGGCRQVAGKVWVRFLAYTACLPAGTGTRGVGSGTFPLNYPLKRSRIKLFIKS